MAIPNLAERPVYTGLTYEKYLELPPINQRYDIIDGDLYMSPAPSDDHQWILKFTQRIIDDHVLSHDLGVLLFAPLDVLIRRLPRLRTRQPDIVFYTKESIGGTSRSAVKAARRRDIPPDLAIEILSSSDHRRVLDTKLTDYASLGIHEVWTIDPKALVVTVLRLERGQYRQIALFAERDYLTSDLLPGFSILVSEIFE